MKPEDETSLCTAWSFILALIFRLIKAIQPGLIRKINRIRSPFAWRVRHMEQMHVLYIPILQYPHTSIPYTGTSVSPYQYSHTGIPYTDTSVSPNQYSHTSILIPVLQYPHTSIPIPVFLYRYFNIPIPVFPYRYFSVPILVLQYSYTSTSVFPYQYSHTGTSVFPHHSTYHSCIPQLNVFNAVP